jgi:hypothetical protein
MLARQPAFASFSTQAELKHTSVRFAVFNQWYRHKHGALQPTMALLWCLVMLQVV